MKVAIIINSFNRLHLLEKCIDSLLPLCNKFYDEYYVHIIDAGSTDGSIDFAGSLEKQFDFITYEVLLGASFSEGCNQAVSTIRNLRSNISCILFFETDNFIYSFDPIVVAQKLLHSNSQIGCVGFSITDFNGTKLQPGSKFLKPIATILGLRLSDYLGLERIDDGFDFCFLGYKFQEYQVIYTSPLLISLQAWNEVGGMDEKLFPFCESDSDLLYRLHKNGYKAVLIHCDSIVHDNLNAASAWSAKRVFDLSRARLSYMRKHNSILLSIIIRPLLFTRHLIEAFFLLAREKSLKIFLSRLSLSINSLKGYV